MNNKINKLIIISKVFKTNKHNYTEIIYENLKYLIKKFYINSNKNSKNNGNFN